MQSRPAVSVTSRSRSYIPQTEPVPTYEFVTLDVFTTTRFGGNQLAVFVDARGLTEGDMQSLAAEFNLSETTFVLPPENPAHAGLDGGVDDRNERVGSPGGVPEC